jgi:hypothetical protein
MTDLLIASVKTKKDLAPPVAHPITIVHAEEDSVEVNVAADPRAVDAFLKLLKAKEKEMLCQKRLLESCREEMRSFKERLENEPDPIEREKLLETITKVGMALRGKKEVFLERFEQWKTNMVKLNQDLRQHGVNIEL